MGLHPWVGSPVAHVSFFFASQTSNIFFTNALADYLLSHHFLMTCGSYLCMCILSSTPWPLFIIEQQYNVSCNSSLSLCPGHFHFLEHVDHLRLLLCYWFPHLLPLMLHYTHQITKSFTSSLRQVVLITAPHVHTTKLCDSLAG